MARATKKAVKRTSSRSKPKAAKAASAKKVKRVTARRATAAKKPTRKSASAPKATARPSTNPANKTAMDMMSFGPNAMADLLPNSVDASNIQDTLMNASQKGAEQVAKSADAATRSLNSMMEISKENMEACVESGSIAADASKHLGAEMVNYANKSFSQNVELSKEFLSCRTLNDMFDLQSKFMKANLDNFFSESVKMSEMAFEAATNASEPINESLSQTTDKLTKTLSEAA